MILIIEHIKNRFSKKTAIGICAAAAVIIFAVLLLFFAATKKQGPSIKNGTLDLSSWDSQKDSIITLNGSWDFYWNRLLTYSDITIKNPSYTYGKVPGSWNSYTINGFHPSGTGKATYRLHIKNAQAGEELSLNIQSVSTAYRMYINDNLVSKSGTLSDSGSFLPKYQNIAADFYAPSRDFDVLILVENRVYARGGIWQSVRLGSPKDIEHLCLFRIDKDMFVLGSLFILIVIFLTAFILEKQQSYSIFLFIGAVLTFVRTTLHGSYAIYTFFPVIPFDLIIRLDYLTIILIPLCVVCFITAFLDDFIGKGTVISIAAFYSLLCIYTFAAPLPLLTGSIALYEITLLITGLYGVFRALKEWSRKETGTRIIVYGSLFLFLMSVIDILYQSSVIDNPIGETFPFGYLVMSLCLVFVILKKYNEYLKTELNFLKAQIRPHFIHNALNTILIISRTDPERSRALLIDFSHYLRSCYDLQNPNELIPLKRELDYVRSYAEIEKARFGRKLRVHYFIEKPDVKIPYLSLQPLVENAIVHGIREKDNGGTVVVYCKKLGRNLRIGVLDNGVGFKPKKSGHMGGSGIGMDNISKRLNRAFHTQLVVEKTKSGGCNVYFELKGNFDE